LDEPITSRKYKIGLIYCLCDRIWKICQNDEDKTTEIVKLKKILARNNYPDDIINKEVDKFVKRRNANNEPDNNEQQPKEKKFIVLPFTNKKADVFAQKLNKLVTTNFPNIDFIVAFKTPNDIGKMFPFKDNIRDVEKQSLVIYRIKCETCNADYIGKSKRILQLRIDEHNDEKKNQSAVQVHWSEYPTSTQTSTQTTSKS